MKNLLFASFLICYSVIVCSAQSLEKYKSLQDSWYFYDNNQTFTRIDPSVKVRNAQITLENDYTDSARIIIQVSQPAFLSISGKLYDQIINSKSYDLDSLFAIHSKNSLLNIKLYGREPFEIIKSEIWTKTNKPSGYSQTTTIKREKASIHNTFIIAYLLILAMLVFIKKNYGEIWDSYTQFRKILTNKDFSDNLYKNRPFEVGTIVTVVFYSFSGMLLLLILYSFSDSTIFRHIPTDYIDSWYFIPTWIAGSFAIFILAYLKYFLVKIFTRTYDFRGYSRFHFYNHLRISSLFFVFFASITLLFYINQQTNIIPIWLIISMVAAYFLKVLFISIKIYNLGTNRIFHLFSYLCTAEFLPAIIFVKIIFFNLG